MENESTITNTTNTTNIATGSDQASSASQTATAQHTDQVTNLGLRTFTQEQLDAIIARERSKATKGWFTAEQMQAKDASIASLTTERDNARADLARAQKENSDLKNLNFLRGKNVPEDMLEFYAFKIDKLVGDGKTFQQAAEEYLKDNPPAGTVRMSTGGGVNNGGGTQSQKPNDIMNALIRGAK